MLTTIQGARLARTPMKNDAAFPRQRGDQSPPPGDADKIRALKETRRYQDFNGQGIGHDHSRLKNPKRYVASEWGKKAKRKTSPLAVTSATNDRAISTPEETSARVTRPDSMTKAQNATMPKAINDSPFTMTGLAWTTNGIINSTTTRRRVLIFRRLTGVRVTCPCWSFAQVQWSAAASPKAVSSRWALCPDSCPAGPEGESNWSGWACVGRTGRN